MSKRPKQPDHPMAEPWPDHTDSLMFVGEQAEKLRHTINEHGRTMLRLCDNIAALTEELRRTRLGHKQ